MSGLYLLGLGALFTGQRARVVQRAKTELKKLEPLQEKQEAKVQGFRTKVDAAEAQVNEAIKTHTAIKRKEPEGTAAQVQEAEDLIQLRQNELISARAQLEDALQDLAVQTNLVAVKVADLEDAAIALGAALAAWDDEEATEDAEAVRLALRQLLFTSTALVFQAAEAPTAAGDPLWEHFKLMEGWTQRLTLAAADYTQARDAWEGGESGLALAALEAAEAVLAQVIATALQVGEYLPVAGLAVARGGQVEIKLGELQGAIDVLDALLTTGDAQGGVKKATAKSLAIKKQAEAVAADTRRLSTAAGILRRKAGGG